MFKKLFLAAALIAVPLMFSQEKASAFGGFGYGVPGYGHGHGHHGYHARHLPIPHHSVHRSYSRVVTPYPSHRYGAGYGYGGGGYCPTTRGYGGYGGHGYGYPGYGGSGISFRIGF